MSSRDRSCVVRWLLDKHYYDEHKKERPFVCADCGQGFFRRYQLVNHIMTHVRADVVTCNEDDAGADATAADAAPAQTQCRLCRQQFKSRVACLRHEVTHADDWAAYTCDVCEKEFLTQRALRRHEQIHSGEKRVSRADPQRREEGESSRFTAERRG